MLVHFGVDTLHAQWSDAVVCIGTFDGVHLGHRAVIAAAVKQASEAEIPGIVVTFDRHPAATLAPERCPPSIASLEDSLREMEGLGVALAVALPFDRTLADTSAEHFLEMLRETLHASRLVIGHDFAFGRGREGNAEWLCARMPTTVVPPFSLDGVRVSSSAIRQAVAEGRIEDAARLLGRPFAIDGIVVGGAKLGRTLGYPTLNLVRAIRQVTPADGIYAGWAETPIGGYLAAISIGFRPTVGGSQRTIEAYLLDYPGDSLYGKPVRLAFDRRLRDEVRFESLEALKDQMARDVAEVGAMATSRRA
ncbi:MAG TPA: riboflavin biosynthesis protein RibF [Fimbriimonadaceae bacterium]|nr:riboflavin biosynthesis protein RibF [Fimbriimonadaceae bacterium]